MVYFRKSLQRLISSHSPRLHHHDYDDIAFHRHLPSKVVDETIRTVAHKEDARPECSTSWQPIVLRRIVLVALICVFLGHAAVVITLFYTGLRNKGLSFATNHHYISTYMPTAVAIVLAAVWRQVDHYCKVLTPWSAIHKHRSIASQAMLLDYVSPILPSSLWKAIRTGHIAVVISLLGTLVFNILIVSATAIFSSRAILQPEINFALHKLPFANGLLEKSSLLTGLSEPAPVYQAYGVAAKGLPYAYGTTTDLVYETLSLSEQPRLSNYTLEIEVKALRPRFLCESAPLDVKLADANTTDSFLNLDLELLFDECTLGAGALGVVALNPKQFITPKRQLSPQIQPIDCSNPAQSNETTDWRLLTLADVRYNQVFGTVGKTTLSGTEVEATSWSTEVINVTSIVCQSSYTMGTVLLRFNQSNAANPTLPSIGPFKSHNETLSNFTNFDIGALTAAALSAAYNMFGEPTSHQYEEEYPNTMFKMMAAVSGGTYEDFLNESIMTTSAQNVLQQIAIQAVSKHLFHASEVEVSGKIQYLNTRLSMNRFATWTTVASFVVLAGFSAALILSRPAAALSQNPEPLAHCGILFARNDYVRRCFGDTILPQEDKISRNSLDSPDEQLEWYRPITMRNYVLIATVSLPIITIVILEVLQRLSDSKIGIANVTHFDNEVVSLSPRVVPTLLMLLIASLFGCMDFNIAHLHPLYELRKNGGDGIQSMFSAYIGRLGPMTLYISFLRRQWPVFLSAIAVLIGNALTIVSSGLYTFEGVSTSSKVLLKQQDYFNATWTNSALNDSSAAVLGSLVEGTGLEYPLFTYQSMALPRIEVMDDELGKGNLESVLETTLPGVRASLQCINLDAGMFNVTASYNTHVQTATAAISAKIPLPEGCLLGGPGGNLTYLEYIQAFDLPSNSSYIAKLLDLHVGPYDDVTGVTAGELIPAAQRDNPSGCPSLAFLYGHADVQDPDETSGGVMVCYQLLDMLQTRVTFNIANMSVSSSHPPVPDEKSAKPILNGPNEALTYSFRIQSHFDETFVSNSHFQADGYGCTFLAPEGDLQPSDLEVVNPALDPFAQGVLCGLPHLPMSTFRTGGVKLSNDTDSFGTPPTAAQRAVFESVQAFYRRYMAQAVSLNMRRTFPENAGIESGGPTFVGTIVDPASTNSRVRLFQHAKPKLALQIMLGIMTICASVALYLSRGIFDGNLVPYNPCSIAGVLSLFAGSKICNPSDDVASKVFPAGVERMSDRDIMEYWKWHGQQFKLDWWDTVAEKTLHARSNIQRYGLDAIRSNEGR